MPLWWIGDESIHTESYKIHRRSVLFGEKLEIPRGHVSASAIGINQND